MSKISFEDKVNTNTNYNIPEIKKVTAENMNEIKEVVNGNDDKVGELSNLNTKNKDNIVNAINSINNKSLIKVTKSEKSTFELGEYGSTKIPLDTEEIKIGDKFVLQNGSVVNVSEDTINVRVCFGCTASSAIKDGYMLLGKNTWQGITSAFSYASNMNSYSLSYTVMTLEPNDELYIKIGNSTSISVEVQTPTFIIVEEI